MGGPTVGRRLWPHRFVLPVVAAAAVLPVAIAANVLPAGSTDLDEVAYLSQAQALRHGHLTLSARTHVPSFEPFLSGVHDGRVVFKYQPAWPAFLALVHMATGSYRPALAIVGAVTVLGTYWLAWELFHRRRIALLAAGLMCLSPFFLVEAGTYLAYAASLAVGLLAAAALVRGARSESRGWLAFGGAAVGLLCFHRAYDGVLWGLPLAAFLALTAGSWRRVAARGLWSALGALPFGVLSLAYDQATTGSMTKAAFRVGGPTDRFGFGLRASFVAPGAAGIHYTVGRAFTTVWQYALDLPRWLPGSVVLLALVVWVAIERFRDPAVRLLVGVAVAFPVGYFFWWGTANAVHFHLDAALGPFYWMPMLGPLTVLGALGVDRALEVASRRSARLGWVVVVLVLVAGSLVLSRGLPSKVRGSGRARSATVALETVPGSVRSVMLTQPEFSVSPYDETVVSPDLRARHLVALVPGVDGDPLPLLASLPGRTIHEVVTQHRPGQLFDPTVSYPAAARLVRTTSFHVVLTGRAPAAAASLDARAAIAGVTNLGLRGLGAAVPARPFTVSAVVTATTISVGGQTLPFDLPVGHDARLEVGFGDGPTARHAEDSVFELRWWVRRVSATEIEVLEPAEGWRRYAFPNGKSAWAEEDVSPELTQR